MIDEAFVLGRFLCCEFKKALFVREKIIACFLQVYSLNSCAIDDAESRAYAVGPSRVIDLDYLKVIFSLVKVFCNLFDVYR